MRYDALGRRIEKVVNGVSTRYIYDNEDILFELDGIGATQAFYLHGLGIDEPLAVSRGGVGGGMFSYHADGLGSITTLTDPSGTPVQTYTYDSFGRIVAETGTVIDPYTYTGREFDPETGLYYYRARYYDPSIGRFLGVDPVFALSVYPYVDNNPTNLVDPEGELPLIAGVAIIGATVGGILEASQAAARGEPIARAFARGAIRGAVGAVAGTLTAIATGGTGLAVLGVGASAGLSSNAVGQLFDLTTGNQTAFDGSSLLADTAVGALTAGLLSKVPVFQQQGFRIGNVKGAVTRLSQFRGFVRNRPLSDFRTKANIQRILARVALGGEAGFLAQGALQPLRGCF